MTVILMSYLDMVSQLVLSRCSEVTITATYIHDLVVHGFDVLLQIPLVQSCKGA